jgi:DNA-binding MarR family transcriptional regulator
MADTTRDPGAPHDEGSADELVSALLTASRVLVGVSARSLAEVEGTVSLSQFRTLVVLEGHGDTRLNHLAARLGVGASTALRAVDRLIAAGLVQRRENPEDRREVVISLTGRGRALVNEVTGRRRDAITAIVQQMPRELTPGLIEALTAFASAADEPSAEADAATRLGW